jgi:hypothetical protein
MRERERVYECCCCKNPTMNNEGASINKREGALPKEKIEGAWVR